MGSVFLELSKRKGFHRRANSRDISGLMNYPIYEDLNCRMKQISWSESIEYGVVRMITPAGNLFMPKWDFFAYQSPRHFFFYFLDHFILIGTFYTITFLNPRAKGTQLEKETRWLEVKAELRCYTEI